MNEIEEAIEREEKNIKHYKIFLFAGSLLTLSIIGAPLGIPVLIISWVLINGCERKITELKLQGGLK